VRNPSRASARRPSRSVILPGEEALRHARLTPPATPSPKSGPGSDAPEGPLGDTSRSPRPGGSEGHSGGISLPSASRSTIRPCCGENTWSREGEGALAIALGARSSSLDSARAACSRMSERLCC
jgi:hypothetical protein